jgi:hypothetical protein
MAELSQVIASNTSKINELIFDTNCNHQNVITKITESQETVISHLEGLEVKILGGIKNQLVLNQPVILPNKVYSEKVE